jgi:hypothetical protein
LKSCIYYDLEAVSAEDVRRARRRTPGAIELLPAGVVWSPEVDGPLPDIVPSSRDFDYQAELMNWIDALFAALVATGASVGGPHTDRTLLEIGRYHFFFEFSSIEQRWRAVCEIQRRYDPNRLTWVAPASRTAELRTLCDGKSSLRIEFMKTARRRAAFSQIVDAAKSIVRPPAKMLARAIRRFATLPARAPALGEGKIIFAEYFPNSAKGLLPVAKALTDSYDVAPTWLALREPVATALRRSGTIPLELSQFSGGIHETRTAFTADDARRLDASLVQMPDKLFMGTGDISNRPYLQRAIQRHLTATLEQAAYWLNALSQAMSRIRPSCVVSTSYSSMPGRAAAVACRAQGGTSVYLQHGLFPDRSFFARFCNDVLLLWGESNRRFMVDQGIDDQRIHVIGATICDGLVRQLAASKSRAMPSAGEPLVIGFMASRTDGAALGYSAAKLCLEAASRATKEFPGSRLLVKIHPGDKTKMVHRLAGGLDYCTLVEGGNSQDVICQSDIVIVASSTTGLEACIADKPLIVLKPKGVPAFGPYAEYEAAIEVELSSNGCGESVAAAIRALQSDSILTRKLAAGRQRLVADMLNGGRGDASALAAQAIAALVQDSAIVVANPVKNG